MIRSVINFFKYLFGKRSEILDLDYKDALLAKANVQIYSRKTHKTIEMVSLKYLKSIHSLNRENAKQVLLQRIQQIAKHRDSILKNNEITMQALNQFLPSVSSIKVVQANTLKYLAFEGNGRIAALKEVFGDQKEVFVEVEQYHFKSKKKIVRQLNRLRKLNGLI